MDPIPLHDNDAKAITVSVFLATLVSSFPVCTQSCLTSTHRSRCACAVSVSRWRSHARMLVEVMSPSNTAREMEEKVALYFGAGARAVWVFNPKKKSVAVYASPSDVRVLGEHDTLEGGEVLPGFRLELSKLFAVGKK